LYQEFEDKQIARTPADPIENLRIAESLFAQALEMGVSPLADPLDGIEIDILLTARLRGVQRAS
jgi:hypothetical protein